MPLPEPGIDDEAIRKAAAAGATDRDIMDIYGCTREYLHQHFGLLLLTTRALRRMTLRTLQTKLAIKGNASMLSLLGKCELGQNAHAAKTTERIPEPQLDYKMG
jgi:hypothetical protein